MLDDRQCNLSSNVIRRFYNESSQTWTVTNALLSEVDNNIQRIVDCAVQEDVIHIRANGTIQPRYTLTTRLPLTMRGDSDVRFTCPEQGAMLLLRYVPHETSACVNRMYFVPLGLPTSQWKRLSFLDAMALRASLS